MLFSPEPCLIKFFHQGAFGTASTTMEKLLLSFH